MTVHHPLRTSSTEETLADDLIGRILNGELHPGEPLREQQLAEDYGVGRYTVRAALRRLTHDGVVRHQPNRGASVSQFTPADIQEIYWLRGIIEEGAARFLAERRVRPREAEHELERFLSLPESAPWLDVVDVDMALHTALVAAVGSPRMDRVFRSLSTEMRFCIIQLRPFYPAPSVLAEEHRQLLDAIATNDGGSAALAMREHLRRAAEDITTTRGK